MGDVPVLQSQEPEGEKETSSIESKDSSFVTYKWWIKMCIYSTFVLSGQSIGTLLGRLYYDKGGNSKWLASLVQTIGFPVLIPFLFIRPTKSDENCDHTDIKKPSIFILAPLYTLLGLLMAGNCMLYSVGLLYLPVTTYSLVCASQLGFNALFSFFLNKQKFTPYIVNSLVILTISSALLMFQNDDSVNSNKSSRSKYVLGFMSTIAASASFALMLSITQLAFQKIFKRESFELITKVSIHQSVVATLALLVGFFASGEWKSLGKEIDEYKLGKASYVVNLVGTAISWQAFTVGSIGLIFKVSSLFSNVISILGLPMAPVLAVIFLHDKMSGVKVMSMLLAIWGFVSYIYQHYLDGLRDKSAKRGDNEISEVSLIERV